MYATLGVRVVRDWWDRKALSPAIRWQREQEEGSA